MVKLLYRESVTVGYNKINVKKTAVYTNVNGDIVSYTSKTAKIKKVTFPSTISPNVNVFLMAMFAEVTENERIIDRHLRDIHPLLDYDVSESQSMLSI